jgi:hypothetical protein
MAANAYLARLALAGTDLQPVLERGGQIETQKVGSLSTTWFEDSPARDVYCGLADLLRGLASEYSTFAEGGSAQSGFKILDAVI